MTTYDDTNIFAKILKGDIPCHRIYEDEDTLVFMDIMPRAPGHTLIIPKTAARNLLDIESTALAKTIQVVQKIALAAQKAFQADGITLHQFSEKAGGQEVFHLHFHVIPRHDGVALKPAGQAMEAHTILAAHAERLRQAL